MALPRLSLRARLTLWAALATALAAALVSGGIYLTVRQLLYLSERDNLLSSVLIVQTRVERDAERASSTDNLGWMWLDLSRIAAEDAQTQGLELRLAAQVNGQWFYNQSAHFPPGLPLDLPANLYQIRGQNRLLAVRELPTLGAAPLWLTVTTDTASLGRANNAFQRAFWALLPLATVLAVIAGWTVSGRLLAPVRQLEEAARAVGESGDLRHPLPLTEQGDELGHLARALQGTFAQLAEARERETDFARAAAHDLRSPLAALTARVQGSLSRPRDAERYRQDLQEIGTDLERLSALTTHLLLLSRDPTSMPRVPVALQPLAANAVDRARELDELADVDLEVAPGLPPLYVKGDPVLLGQAVWNLIVNAMKYGAGSPVLVRLGQEGAAALITVQDEGPGVSAEVLARLGQAFYRPDASRQGQAAGGGHGLGLALAGRAAALHGGRLELESTEGAGFTARLVLPTYKAPIGTRGR